MTEPLRILMLEDDPDDEALVRRELARHGIAVARHTRVETLAGLRAALEDEWDIALLDFNLPQAHALSALATLRERDVDLPAIVVTGSIDENIAATVFRAGARDVVLKSRLGRLGPAVLREASELAGRRGGRIVSERLREVEASFDAFLEHLPVGAWIASDDGHVVYANPALGQLVGTPVRSIVGKRIDVSLGATALTLVAKTSTRPSSDRRADVSTVGLSVASESRVVQLLTFRVGDGQIGGAALDLTERHRAELAARENEERLRAVANASSDGLVTIDIDGRIVATNTALETMLRSSASGIVGRPLSHFLDATSVAEFPARLARWFALSEQHPATYCGEIVLSVGTDRLPLDVRAGTWSLRGQRYLGLVLRDMSHHRSLEHQLRTAQKMEAVGQLAGGIAHDFNNILAAIRAFSDLLAQTLEPEDERLRDLGRVQEAVDRGAALVRQLLAFSRQQVLQPTHVDINALLRRLADMLARTLTERISLETELDPDAGSVFADAAQLEQIVMNLVVNARDAIPAHGHIVVSTTRGAPPRDNRTSLVDEPYPEDCVVVSVTDDGTGMDEATQARIFEPFFTTKEHGRGTGLGLATVYGIVRQSNGFIRVRSSPGKGSTFQVYLPRSSHVPHVLDTASRARVREPAKGERVALVEDDALVRAALARVLRSAGFTVQEHPNAEETLRVFADPAARPDVLVSDVLLPGMTGVDLLRALAERDLRIPVVLISGHDRGEVEGVGEREPIRFLHKPVASAELLAAVHDALGDRRKTA